jgi:TolB-like protein
MYVALVAALLSLGLFLLGRYTARNTEARPEITSAKSIAVLPFENLSEEKANAYFADGIHDEIITRLANVGDLKVISRSSTERYKTKPEDLSEIARQLGVAHFLEGSVQKSGDRVRINVQLVRAGTNDHLWAQIFDRQLTDIFAVESEVATAITGALQAKLTGRERAAVEQKPTNNLDAYDVYLKGLDLFTRPGGGSQVQMAADFLKEAVRLDPNFALAWAKLAEVNAAIYFKQFDTTPARKEAARVAAAGLGDKEAALREGERSLAMLPPTEDPVMAPGIEEFFARTEAQVGEIDRAVARLERLLTIPYGPGPVTQALLRLDPSWNPLRSHPRFEKLISGPEPKTTYR